MIHQKNKAHVKSVNEPTSQNVTLYTKLRNMVNYKLRKEGTTSNKMKQYKHKMAEFAILLLE